MDPAPIDSPPPGASGALDGVRPPHGRGRWLIAGAVVLLAAMVVAITGGQPKERGPSLAFVGFSNHFPRPTLAETQFHAYCWFTNGSVASACITTTLSRRNGNEWVDDDEAEFYSVAEGPFASRTPSNLYETASRLRPGEAVLVSFVVGQPHLPLRVVMEVHDQAGPPSGLRRRLWVWYRQYVQRAPVLGHYGRQHSVTNEFWPER